MTRVPYKKSSTLSENSKRSASQGDQLRAIDQLDPDLAQVCLLLRNQNSLTYVSEKSGVSKTCMRNWMSGKTKRPYNVTITFVMRALGYGKRWTR